MSDEWLDFQGKRQLFDKRDPVITVQAGGNMGLSRQAFEAIGSPKAIVFRYNPNRKAIGIRAAREGELHSYVVRKQQQSDSYVITAKAFLQYIEYPVGQLRSYTPQIQDGMLIIDWGKDEADHAEATP